MKTCPDCAEEVQDAARVCRYCGYRLEGEAAGSSGLTFSQAFRKLADGIDARRAEARKSSEQMKTEGQAKAESRQKRLNTIPDDQVDLLVSLMKEAGVKLKDHEYEADARSVLLDMPGQANEPMVIRLGTSGKSSYLVLGQAGMVVTSAFLKKLPRIAKWADVESVGVGRGIYRRELVLEIAEQRTSTDLDLSHRKTVAVAKEIEKRIQAWTTPTSH